jgi:hypothetical protein
MSPFAIVRVTSREKRKQWRRSAGHLGLAPARQPVCSLTRRTADRAAVSPGSMRLVANPIAAHRRTREGKVIAR